MRTLLRRPLARLLAAAAAAALLAVPGTAQVNAPAATGSPRPLFVELEGSGLDFAYFNGMSGEYYMPEITCGGGGLLDYDGDGDLDLYLLQGAMLGPGKTVADATLPPRGPLTDRLYRNDLGAGADGSPVPRFVEVTAAAGIDAPGFGCGLAAGDYDGDGATDLYVANLGPNQLWRNRGDGTFSDATAESGADDPRWSVPAVFFDFDADGDLDLFVGNYLAFSYAEHKVCRTAAGARDYCNPEAFAGVPDRLLANRGDGAFEDVTGAAGLAGVASKSLGAVSGDFDGDGRLDLYVADDGVPNQLWLQGLDGGFRDAALLSGCAVNGRGRPEASMGVDAADPDADGDLDLVMTHITGETNTLFVNEGGGAFRDMSAATGLGPPSWSFTGWGTAWIDADGDGWLDLPVVNGAVRTIQALADAGDPFPFHQPKQLYRNLGARDGAPRFAEVGSAAGPAFARSEVSRGLAAGDLDQDGDADLLVVSLHAPARVLLGTASDRAPWLGARLAERPGGRDMLGGRAALERLGQPTLWRRARTDGGYAAAHDPRILFGLGEDAAPRILRAHWPDGKAQELRAAPAGRYLILYRRMESSER